MRASFQDLHVYDVDAVRDRCLILATDGVWNVLNPDMAVDTVFDAERNNEKFMINPQVGVYAALALQINANCFE